MSLNMYDALFQTDTMYYYHPSFDMNGEETVKDWIID